MDPVDFYRLAREYQALTLTHGEAHDRAVARAAYYSAFLVARTRAGLDHVRQDVHARTINFFEYQGRAGNANSRDIANELRTLRNVRVSADYNMGAAFPRSRVTAALGTTARVLGRLGVLAAASAPAPVAPTQTAPPPAGVP